MLPGVLGARVGRRLLVAGHPLRLLGDERRVQILALPNARDAGASEFGEARPPRRAFRLAAEVRVQPPQRDRADGAAPRVGPRGSGGAVQDLRRRRDSSNGQSTAAASLRFITRTSHGRGVAAIYQRTIRGHGVAAIRQKDEPRPRRRCDSAKGRATAAASLRSVRSQDADAHPARRVVAAADPEAERT